jgi:hypothetical protein
MQCGQNCLLKKKRRDLDVILVVGRIHMSQAERENILYLEISIVTGESGRDLICSVHILVAVDERLRNPCVAQPVVHSCSPCSSQLFELP